MRYKFPRLAFLKKQSGEPNPLYTQSWVYSGITAYFSSNEEFDRLEFVDEDIYPPIYDYQRSMAVNDGRIYGNVYEGNVNDWFSEGLSKNVKVVTGHVINEKINNTDVIGFDYWDVRTYTEFQNPIFYNEINRLPLSAARYDVVIATGMLRDYREKFLQIFRNRCTNLSVVTDDNQDVYPTDLRFGNLGFEVYLNKLGADKFTNYTPHHSFFDMNESRALDHMPHKKIYQTSLVNAILESSVHDTTSPFLTEKTYKSIAHSRPFVILGDTNSLEKLKSQGFQTFSDFCDESYDKLPDLEKRIKACTQALIELVDACKINPKKIDDICAYNQNLFFSRKRHFDNLAEFGGICLEKIYN